MREVLHLDKADVIVSFDRDFLGDDAAMIRNSRGFASKRSPLTTKEGMNRLYMVESTLSLTGAKADHRIAMAPGGIATVAAALASALGVAKSAADRIAGQMAGAAGEMTAETSKFVAELAKDLKGEGRTGKVVVLAGPSQPAAVHALCRFWQPRLSTVTPATLG